MSKPFSQSRRQPVGPDNRIDASEFRNPLPIVPRQAASSGNTRYQTRDPRGDAIYTNQTQDRPPIAQPLTGVLPFNINRGTYFAPVKY